MAAESLTYAEIGERLGVSVHAARALVKRLRLPRMLNNDRKVIAQIDFSEIKHRPQSIAVATNGLGSLRGCWITPAKDRHHAASAPWGGSSSL
jgi:hypothetical protein